MNTMIDEKKTFDPIRDILMFRCGKAVRWGLGAALVLLFCLYALFGLGFAGKGPAVAVVAAACAAVLLLGTWRDLEDQPVIVLLCTGFMFFLLLSAHLSMMEIKSGRMANTLTPLLQSMWNYDLLTAMSWTEGSWSGGYLILMGLLSRLETFPWIYGIKLINLVGISFGALAVRRLYRLNGGTRTGSVLISGISMLALTILLNSGLWAHCDAVFSALSLWGLVFLLQDQRNHPWLGCLLWGLAVGFKLQAAFLFPLLIPMFMERKISIRHLAALAAGFLVLHIPMFLDKQSFLSVLGRYSQQITGVAYEGAGLTDNAPGVYGLMLVASVREFSGMGLFFGEAVALLLAMGMVRRGPLSQEQWIRCAILLAFGLPMILPQMNVRMLYLAFLLALTDARNIRGIVIAVLIEMISLLGYMKGVFGNEVIPVLALSLISLTMTVYMIIGCLGRKEEKVNAEG